MRVQYFKGSGRIALIILLPIFSLIGILMGIQSTEPGAVQAAGFDLDKAAQQADTVPYLQEGECDGTETGVCNDGWCPHDENRETACAEHGGVAVWYGSQGPPSPETEEMTSTEPVCDCSGDIYDCDDFASQPEAQACFEYCRSIDQGDVHKLDGQRDERVCENLPLIPPTATPIIYPPTPTPGAGEPSPTPTEEVPAEPEVPGSDNLVYNGNFEFGFYTVPQLGFEARDVGHVPNDWQWFRNEKYGKYNIYNNEGFGLVCPDDINTGTIGKNSLSLHIQSTDESDARLGVYQTIDVTPNQEYLFAISGTIQVQRGGSSPDINHKVILAFDQTGGSNWRAIPHEQWTLLPWQEQELEFRISGPDDPDIAAIQDYYTVVKTRSDKLTIFLGVWRRWANWRTGIVTLDCVSLIPLSKVNVPAIVPRLSEISTTAVDDALEGSSAPAPAAEPAAAPVSDGEAAPAPEAAIIPPSGGVLDPGNNFLIGAVSVILILGLIGAGIWNIRRQRSRLKK